MSDASLTGGCQCGAVRFRVEGGVSNAGVCHCRMCQKAFGSFFAPLVVAERIVWTRGEPASFRSSSIARRGFCRDCGTPLTFEPDEGRMELAIGAFDDPALIRPTIQVGLESRLPWLSELNGLPGHRASGDNPDLDARQKVRSFQHPDHET